MPINKRALVESNGTLDPTLLGPTFTNGDVMACVVQPDGKLVIGGIFAKVNGVARMNIARLHADGTLDTSFDPSGGPDGAVRTIKLQADGKIIILGEFFNVNGVSRGAGLARLNANGSLDSGFNPGRVISYNGESNINGDAISTGKVDSVVLQPDPAGEKIVVAGQFFYVITGAGDAKVERSCVARFLNNGTFDPGFTPGSGFVKSSDPTRTYVLAAVAQSTGRLVFAGDFDRFHTTVVNGLARTTANGASKPFPSAASPAGGIISELFAQADDKIVVAGSFTSFGGSAHAGIARMEINGGRDANFNPPALMDYADTRWPSGIAQQQDGKLILAGGFHSLGADAANGIVRINPDGTRDASFDSSAGTGRNGYGSCVALLPGDAGAFLGGYFSGYEEVDRNNIALVKPNGALEPSFAPRGGATDGNPAVVVLGVQSTGQIIAGGIFSSVNGRPQYNLVRLNPDGSVDPSFAIGQGTSRSVRALQILPGDKILIAGQFGGINGVQRMRVAILNADGSLDPTFDPGAGPNNIVYSIARDANGNVYLGGPFTAVAGTSKHGLAKLKPDGALEGAFHVGSGPSPERWIRAMIAPSGRLGLVIGGSFTSFNGTAVGRIARLNATTGALDTTFRRNTGSGFDGAVRALARTSKGKYVVGGNFSSFNGTVRSRVARLNSTGSIDLTFGSPPLSGRVLALSLQGSKTFAAGAITAPTNSVARLRNDASPDPAFATGTGVRLVPPSAFSAAAQVEATALEPGGKLLVGGTFNDYNGVSRVCLARLTGLPVSILSLERISQGPRSRLVLEGIGVPGVTYRIEATPALTVPFELLGRTTATQDGRWSFQDFGGSMLSQRFYQIAPD